MEKLQEANCWLEFLVHWKVRLFHFPPRVPFCAFPLRLSQPSTTSAVRDIPAADSSSVSFECACFLMPCFLMPCFLYALLPVCPATHAVHSRQPSSPASRTPAVVLESMPHLQL